MLYKCSKCEKVMDPSSDEIIEYRGYYWHRPCARIFAYTGGREYVDFPSDGKMIPETILEVSHADKT